MAITDGTKTFLQVATIVGIILLLAYLAKKHFGKDIYIDKIFKSGLSGGLNLGGGVQSPADLKAITLPTELKVINDNAKVFTAQLIRYDKDGNPVGTGSEYASVRETLTPTDETISKDTVIGTSGLTSLKNSANEQFYQLTLRNSKDADNKFLDASDVVVTKSETYLHSTLAV